MTKATRKRLLWKTGNFYTFYRCTQIFHKPFVTNDTAQNIHNTKAQDP